MHKLAWLKGNGVTAREQLIELQHWIMAQLCPVMAAITGALSSKPPNDAKKAEEVPDDDGDDDQLLEEQHAGVEAEEGDSDEFVMTMNVIWLPALCVSQLHGCGSH